MSSFRELADAYSWLSQRRRMCDCAAGGAAVAYTGYEVLCRTCAENYKVGERPLVKVREYNDLEKRACQILAAEFGGTRWNTPEHWTLPGEPPELHSGDVGEELGGDQQGDDAGNQGDVVPSTERTL